MVDMTVAMQHNRFEPGQIVVRTDPAKKYNSYGLLVGALSETAGPDRPFFWIVLTDGRPDCWREHNFRHVA